MDPTVKQRDGSYALTIEFAAGMIPASVLDTINSIVKEEGVLLHITTAQKLMLLNLTKQASLRARVALTSAGARFKYPRQVHQPRVCVGSRYCKIGLTDTLVLGELIHEQASGLDIPCTKIKIGVSGCGASCAHSTLADIGFVGKQDGYTVFMGGKAGYRPIQGRLIASSANEEEALRLLVRAIDIYRDNIEEEKKLVRLYNVIEVMGFEKFRKQLINST